MIINRECIAIQDIEKVFSVVNEIDLYSNFVPYCMKSEVKKLSTNELIGTLNFNIKGVDISFTTKNIITPNEHIKMTLVEGPFKHLTGSFAFERISKNTQIKMVLEYESNNFIVDSILDKSMNKISNLLIDSFVLETDKRYGKK